MIFTFLREFWLITSAMAPYLLLGFAAAGLMTVLISRQFIEQQLLAPKLSSILKATLFGIPLPLCSCAIIPVTSSLRKQGASKGATVAFLTTTPQTGFDSIAATFSLMGGIFALARVLAALASGILTGLIVQLTDRSEPSTRAEDPKCCCCANESKKPDSKWRSALRYSAIELPRDIALYLLIGMLVSAAITTFLPANFFSTKIDNYWVAMLSMLIVGIPLYVCSTASIPIAAGLITAGISPGAALVFLIAGPATNTATICAMWKVIGHRTTIIYLGSLFVIALAAGVALDAFSLQYKINIAKHCRDTELTFFAQACAVLLLVLIGIPILKKIGLLKTANPQIAPTSKNG